MSFNYSKEGGPAFPVPVEEWWDEKLIGRTVRPGMTLRDYFAGQALANVEWGARTEEAAEWAYNMADAMLAHRQRGSEK